jgi:hypothetical protein
VKRGGLGVDECPAELGHRLDAGNVDFDSVSALRLESGDACLHRLAHIVGRSREEVVAWYADLQTFHAALDLAFVIRRRQARGLVIALIVAGEHRQHSGTVADGARQGAHDVHGGRKLHGAETRYAAVGRPQTDDAVGGGGDADRATGIGAQAGIGCMRGDRRAGTAGGPAGHVLRIDGIAAIAEVEVMPGRAERELGHIEGTDAERAGRLHPSHHRGRLRGDELAANARSVSDAVAGAREHVLVCERHAVQEPERAAARAPSASISMKQLVRACAEVAAANTASVTATLLSLPCRI